MFELKSKKVTEQYVPQLVLKKLTHQAKKNIKKKPIFN